jgi:hypothetical protein
MSLGSSILGTPSASSDGRGGTGNLDAQLASLMEEFLDAIRLQNSLKKRIKQLLGGREAEAKRKEDKAREALREAEEERKAMEIESVVMMEKLKQAQMMDDEEEYNVQVEKASPPSPQCSLVTMPKSEIEEQSQFSDYSQPSLASDQELDHSFEARPSTLDESLFSCPPSPTRPSKKYGTCSFNHVPRKPHDMTWKGIWTCGLNDEREWVKGNEEVREALPMSGEEELTFV